MGLDVSVGFFADLRVNDPEGAGWIEAHLSFVGMLLKEAGLPPHVEPIECESWSAQMFGYSGLHYLRRIAAHLDAGLHLPPPGDDKSADDPLLAAYFDDVLGKKSGLLERLLRRKPRFARKFDHLIVHSDAEGFYLPLDFPHVLFADDKKLPGGMLGSVPRLLAELERLATALAIPDYLHSQSEDLWEAAEPPRLSWRLFGLSHAASATSRSASCR